MLLIKTVNWLRACIWHEGWPAPIGCSPARAASIPRRCMARLHGELRARRERLTFRS